MSKCHIVRTLMHWLNFNIGKEINFGFVHYFLQYGLTSSRYLAEITRLRLQYDDTKKKINSLKHALTDLEDDMVPGQNESDKDRCKFFFKFFKLCPYKVNPSEDKNI